ncbi:MAG: putative membrane protein YfcA [Marinobacter maritimus]|jgi:uncharacterized membrane protein YfcA
MEFSNELLFVILSLIATGCLAGLLAGLLGVGGGIIIVPVLFFVFQMIGVSPEAAMPIATATSLATMVFTSLSSIRAHIKRGNVDLPLLKTFAPFVIIGVLAGSVIVTQINGLWLSGLFGFIAIMAALNMILRAGAKPLASRLPGMPGKGLMATTIGFFSVMIGIGGGTLTVPSLTAFNYPIHKAVGTAAAVGFLIAFPGALSLLIIGQSFSDAPPMTYGLVNILACLFLIPLTVFFAPIGARVSSYLNAKLLKRIFAVSLIITGFRMLLQAF